MVFCCIRSLSCAIAWWSSILWSNVGLLTNRKKTTHTHILRELPYDLFMFVICTTKTHEWILIECYTKAIRSFINQQRFFFGRDQKKNSLVEFRFVRSCCENKRVAHSIIQWGNEDCQPYPVLFTACCLFASLRHNKVCDVTLSKLKISKFIEKKIYVLDSEESQIFALHIT